MPSITPVILSGGAGTRLWPASRSMHPKQLLSLAGEKTMLQATALRTRGLANSGDRCLIVANEAHRFSVAEQLDAIGMRWQIILEPEGRNTAPAAALAALQAAGDDPDAILLIMPADHVIRDVEAFRAAVGAGAAAAEAGRLVTFGVVPTQPETGYGYIRANAVHGNSAYSNSAYSEVAPVEEFVEKPDLAAAKSYLESGEYYWNSGMFLFRARAYLEELDRFAPDIAVACKASMQDKSLDGGFVRPDEDAFLACPSDSIDYAVMEQSSNAAVIPLDAGWSDVGSWSALQDVTPGDADGNTLNGDVLAHDCKDSFVQAESRLVAAVGLRDVIVVETKDSVLVAHRNRSQDVKVLVDRLEAEGRPEKDLHRQVFRPWGSYDSLDGEEGFQVKRLIVKPGAVLSPQKHARRSEHWIVVKGRACVTRNGEEFDLNRGESTGISIGDVHRIANPYDEPCHIIEVQCDEDLGEDDIVRLEDNDGR